MKANTLEAMFRSCLAALPFLLLNTQTLGQAAPAMMPEQANEPYQGAWKVENEVQAAALWKALAEKEPANVNAHYNWFVNERNAALARNEGEVSDADRKKLDSIADDLKRTAPGSFEANMAEFHLHFPDRKAITHLNNAAAVDPKRPELLGPQLAKAMLEGNDAAIGTACTQLKERGGVSQALIDVANDLLQSIDKDGIVFTNGEMDTYPAMIRQRVFGTRKDVLVIDRRSLADAAYRQRTWGQARASGRPPETADTFIKGLLDATTRPVFLALSLDPDVAKDLEGELYATGIALRYSHQRVENIALLEQRWSRMSKNLHAGPLSANYLLPGIVLLKHYRSVGDETKASLLEHEVRAMADALGQTQRLLKLGVLEH